LVSSFLRAWLKNLSTCEGNVEVPQPTTKAREDWMPWPFLLRPTTLGPSSHTRLVPDPVISWLHDMHNIQAGAKSPLPAKWYGERMQQRGGSQK